MKRKREICNSVIMKEVSQELGLPLTIIKDIVSTQSKLTIDVIQSNSFDSVRWPYMGIFKAKVKAVQVINHLKGLNEQQKEEFRRDIMTGKIKLNPAEVRRWENDSKEDSVY